MKKLVFFKLLLLLPLLGFSQELLPKMTLKNMEGKQIDVVSLAEEKLILFSFWATWCVPCINELDAISEDYVDWQDETGVEVIAVSIDNARTTSRVRPMVHGKAWDFEVLFDTNQDFKRAMNVETIPQLFLVKNGKIVFRKNGYTPGSESELFGKIKEHSN